MCEKRVGVFVQPALTLTEKAEDERRPAAAAASCLLLPEAQERHRPYVEANALL